MPINDQVGNNLNLQDKTTKIIFTENHRPTDRFFGKAIK